MPDPAYSFAAGYEGQRGIRNSWHLCRASEMHEGARLALGTPAAVEPKYVESVTTVPSACLNTGTVPLIRRVETSENLVLVRYSFSLYISVET